VARHADKPLPPCYALVQPGLEEIAGEEIEQTVKGEVKRTARGLVVFRVPTLDADLFDLRTVEDVFLLAWGTDQLTYRAEDLERIRRWTAKDGDWDYLFRLHHNLRPLTKGKPTYHFVTQMEGEHGYRRKDARKAFIEGLFNKIPAGWREVEENAYLEVWLTIHGKTAISGVRLTDREMRHRSYKVEHRPASLRPSVAAAMVRVAEIKPKHRILDPMCGAGTILAEHWLAMESIRFEKPPALGGDLEHGAVIAAQANLRKLGTTFLNRWDACELPLPPGCVDRILSNPPFGKQLGNPAHLGRLYRAMLREYDRVLVAGGKAVLLVADGEVLDEAAAALPHWRRVRVVRVRVLGQSALITVWRKGGP
jgi:23S rRNA G2445 N2-methylase RlmL